MVVVSSETGEDLPFNNNNNSNNNLIDNSSITAEDNLTQQLKKSSSNLQGAEKSSIQKSQQQQLSSKMDQQHQRQHQETSGDIGYVTTKSGEELMIDDYVSSSASTSSDQHCSNQLRQIIIRLYSKDYQQILQAIYQIKNLTIGNNKFKTYYLNDKVLEKLIELLNSEQLKPASSTADLSMKGLSLSSSTDRFELLNQILITLGSFSLGTLDHVLKLVYKFRLHKYLFNFILSLSQLASSSNNNSTDSSACGADLSSTQSLNLIEASLRCLSNIYTTAQLVPSLIFLIDSFLYSKSPSPHATHTIVDPSSPYLNSLLNIFSLSNTTKQTVINIMSISASNMLIASINSSPNSLLLKSSMSKSKINRKLNYDIQCFNYNRNVVRNFRYILINSGCIGKFAVLLTNLQPLVQLNALKFYASICFENYEAAISILNTSFCEMPLVDLISLYLSGDNSVELQLYAAKCLANLCRSTTHLVPTTNRTPANLLGGANSTTSSTSHCCDSMETSTHELVNEMSSSQTNIVVKSLNSDTVTPKHQQQQQPSSSSLSSSTTALATDHQTIRQLVDYSSPLIRLKTLPTLIHLCFTCSNNYRNCRNGCLNITNLTSLLISSGGGTGTGAFLASKLNKLSNTTIQMVNMFLLIQSLSTLTYLIEQSAELQEKASHLEQIIGTISHNIEDSYHCFNSSSSSSTLNAKSLYSLKSPVTTAKSEPIKAVVGKSRRTRRLKHKSKNISKRKSRKLLSTSWTSANCLLADSSSSTTNVTSDNQLLDNPLRMHLHQVQSSIFSSFYIKYNQFATKGIHIKLNEHQYKLSSLNGGQAKLSKSISELDKRAGKVSCRSRMHRKHSKKLLKPLRFLSTLSKSVNKCLIAVCFHTFAAFASNSEDARRQISDQSGMLSHIVSSIQISCERDAASSDEKVFDEAYEQYKLEMKFLGSQLRKENEMEESDDDEEDNDNDEGEEEYDEEEEDDDYSSDSSGNNTMNENLDVTTAVQGAKLDELFDDSQLLEFEYFDELEEIENDRLASELKMAMEANNFANKSQSPLFDDHNCILRFSALCLVHSLSRSVHQLRTKFLDHKIWSSILDLIQRAKSQSTSLNKIRSNQLIQHLQSQMSKTANLRKKKQPTTDDDENENEEMNYSASQYGTSNHSGYETSNKFSDSNNENEDDDERESNSVQLSLVDENEQNLICVLTATLANLLLEFSPCKEMMVENGIIKTLVELVDHKNLSVKINCLWALTNMAFHAEQKVKQQILSTVTMEKLFQLLTEQDEILIVKTLGLLRNLIYYRPHIDLIMTLYGTKIIQAIIMILESEYYSSRIKEQALCILVNVADGSVSKDFIMGNEDLLRKINSFMTHSCVQLQIAAVCCISNLLANTDDGAADRQQKLKEMGAQRILHKISHSSDPFLAEKVKHALQQFSPLSNLNSLAFGSSSLSSSNLGGSSNNNTNNQSTSSSSSSSTTSINS